MLNNSQRLKNARVEAVADLSEKARNGAKNKGIKKVYEKYEDMLKDHKIDAVIICLPNFLHEEAAVKSAEYRKDILLEKPLARSVGEGERILSAANKNAVKLMVGFDMRFEPAPLRIHDQIRDGYFGDVQLAEATNISGGPFSPRSDHVGPVQVPSWWLNRDLVGGGALLDLGSHLIDLFVWYFGAAQSAKCYLKHLFKTDLEDTATCVLKFKNGTVGIAKVGWFSKGFVESLQICGTAKNTLIQLCPKTTARIALSGIAKKFVHLQSDPRFWEIQHFVDCIQNDEQPSPSGEEGLLGLQAISMAYQNAEIVE